MQAFKLVNGGFVDRVIVFDELPERLMRGIRTKEAAGFPRAWAKWLASIGSTRPIFKTETTIDAARNYTFKHTPIGQEPCFFIMEYVDINADKQKWREISEYIRQNVSTEVRLKEKLEDMALALAPNPTSELTAEPEDIPVIPVPRETTEVKPDIIQAGEQIIVQENAPKRRGRPKKVAVEA